MAWLTRPDNITFSAASKATSADFFLGAVLVGFDGMRDGVGGEPTRWNDRDALDFTSAVFDKKTRVSSGSAFTTIKSLALKGAFDFEFCRRAAYYLTCVDLAAEDARRGVIESPKHYWDSPEDDLKPWR